MLISQSEIKYLRSLLHKKIREVEHKFLLEGWHQLHDALNSSFQIEMIAVRRDTDQKSDYQAILNIAIEHRIPIKEIKPAQLNQISDSVHSQGVIALVCQKITTFDIALMKTAKLIIACDRVTDPGNLGTILRTCDWFGVDNVLLGEGSVSLYNEKVVRSTAGSIFHLNIFENLNLKIALSQFKSEGYKVIATTLKGEPFHKLIISNKSVLLLGNEAHGLNAETIQMADEELSIPRYGKAESLNVGIACGIFLAHWKLQSYNK